MLKNCSAHAGLLFLLGFTPSVLAQAVKESNDAPVVEMEQIFVVGIRASILNAIDEKRNADSIIEVIAAEDIGKLPEFTIIESLARLPGMSSGRDRGNGAGISVRGLGNELTTSLMNGRELATHNASRSPRFDQFPTELIHGASVYKTSVAKQQAGGIAGTVNLNTIRPLAVKERKINFNANFEYQELAASLEDGDSFGDRESISYIDQFFDDRLGIAVGLANSTRPVGTVRAAMFNQNPSTVSFHSEGVNYVDVTLPYGYETSVRTGQEERQGVISAIQFRPTDSLELNYDLFFSQFDVEEDQSGFRTENLNASGINYADIDIAGGVYDANTQTHRGGAVRSARMTGFFDVHNVNEIYREEDELLATGLNLAWNGDGNWEVSSDLSYSRAEKTSHFVSVETKQIVMENDQPQGITAHFDGSDPIPAFSFSTSLTEKSKNVLPESQVIIDPDTNGAQNVVDQVGAISLDFERRFDESFFSSAEFGFRSASREKELIFGNQTVFLLGSNEIPESMLQGSPLGSFDGDLAATLEANPVLRFDVEKLIGELYGAGIQPMQDGDTRRRSWSITEDIFSAYFQMNFEQNYRNGMVLSGNFGIRYEDTETQSDSVFYVQNFGEDDRSRKNSFSDTLPSLNLSLDIDQSNKVRLNASRAITRPALDDLNSGAGIFVSGGLDAYGGNPELEPYRADQIDIGYEYYFSEETAFTAAVFYKDLDTIIVNQRLTGSLDLDGSGAIEDSNSNGINENGMITQPVNQGGASIQGLELSYNQAFSGLPSPFDGLGVYATVSFNDADMEVDEAFNDQTFNFPGFSERNGNVTLWYSSEKFEARIAYRFVDDFVRRVDGQALAINESESVVDMQASYYLTPTFQLLIQAKNLTDDPYSTNHGNSDLHGRYEQFGRSYSVGFSLSL